MKTTLQGCTYAIFSGYEDNGFGWRGRCRDWGTTASQVSMFKKPSGVEDKRWVL